MGLLPEVPGVKAMLTCPNPGVPTRLVGALGTVSTSKSSSLKTVPHRDTTEILPVVAVPGTMAVRVLSSTITKEVALTPLNLTAVTAPNANPLMVTSVPDIPCSGVKAVMAYAGATSVMLYSKAPMAGRVALLSFSKISLGRVEIGVPPMAGLLGKKFNTAFPEGEGKSGSRSKLKQSLLVLVFHSPKLILSLLANSPNTPLVPDTK